MVLKYRKRIAIFAAARQKALTTISDRIMKDMIVGTTGPASRPTSASGLTAVEAIVNEILCQKTVESVGWDTLVAVVIDPHMIETIGEQLVQSEGLLVPTKSSCPMQLKRKMTKLTGYN